MAGVCVWTAMAPSMNTINDTYCPPPLKMPVHALHAHQFDLRHDADDNKDNSSDDKGEDGN